MEACTRACRGVSQQVRLDLRVGSSIQSRIQGAMLWTHFGVSGPAALDLSRHWLRAREEGQAPVVTASLIPAATFETADARWLALAREQPRTNVHTALSRSIPAARGVGRARHDCPASRRPALEPDA